MSTERARSVPETRLEEGFPSQSRWAPKPAPRRVGPQVRGAGRERERRRIRVHKAFSAARRSRDREVEVEEDFPV